MKILIISKLLKFKEEKSKNRYNFLKFLDKRSNNIYIKDENKCNENKIKIINPDIIIYYWLTKYNKFNQMLIEGFKNININKLLLVEDIQHTESYIKFYNNYNFDGIILHYINKNIRNKVSKYINIFYELPQYIDNIVFRDYKLNKDIDILIYGDYNSKYYNFRNKIMKELNKIKKIYNVCIINKLDNITESNLSKLINRSYITICTCSDYDLHLKKYKEVILSKSLIVGNIPSDFNKEYSNKIINISKSMSELEIYNNINNILKDKKKIIKIVNKNYIEYKNKYNYETGYNKLIDLLHYHYQSVKNSFH